MARPLKLIVAQVTNNLEEEEESMDLKQRIGLKGLLANMNKGSTSKEAPLDLSSPPIFLLLLILSSLLTSD